MDIREFFRKSYFKESCEMCGLNNIKADKMVYATAKNTLKWFDDYSENNSDIIIEYVRSVHGCRITHEDGSRILSASISTASRGYRYKSVVLDYRNITLNIFELVILPSGYACSQDDVEFIEGY